MTPLRQKMTEDLRIRNYRPRTIRAYVGAVSRFARFFGRSPDQLGPEHIRKFQLDLVGDGEVSWSWLNVHVCALRFFYGVTLGRDDVIVHIPYAKQPKKLPAVLTRDEVTRFLWAVDDPQIQILFMTMYATGMRRHEAQLLRVQDVDSGRGVIRVLGKGQKQRLVPLSTTLLETLRAYWVAYRPDELLFPGHRLDRPIAEKRVSRARRAAIQTAGLERTFTTHVLRHSFATHALESGVDIRRIQVILGHPRITTTAVYLHVCEHFVSGTASPLDLLDLGLLDVEPS